jgi:Fe-S cluster assembly scaffold protein SufB
MPDLHQTKGAPIMTESTWNSTEDFEIKDFVIDSGTSQPSLIAPNQFSKIDAQELAEVGVLFDSPQRAGTFVVQDFHTVCSQTQAEGLEVLPIAEALKKYDWLVEKYAWKLIDPDTNKITRFCADQKTPQGYFIRVAAGAKVEFPYQAALYQSHANIAQAIHNIVIVEDDAELTLITGCATQHEVTSGVHLAVSEQFIGKRARFTNTMVHSWGPKVSVRPHSATIVDEDGIFESNYVSLRPAADIRSNPKTWLNGDRASARYYSVILGSQGSHILSGGEVYLNGEDTSAELAHRAICTGGQISQTGLLTGSNRCRAHIDCSGMILDPGKKGFIESTPGIRSQHPEAMMSHEASIGKIAPEQVEYLQSRGIEERQAVSMIIRGFLNADIAGLGEELDARIDQIAEMSGHGEG